ncbi:MAG: DUF5615 family PIN-like protein [Nitrospiria bacterium]
MPVKLYLDEDIDPLLAQVLRDRRIDCLSTQEADHCGLPDADQLAFAAEQERAILTFNVKDYVQLAREYAISNKHHRGIVVSNHLPFRELLRRVLGLILRHTHEGLNDKLLWLQDYEGVNTED